MIDIVAIGNKYDDDDDWFWFQLSERIGFWWAVLAHVDDDATRRNDCRSAAEEETFIDDERQKTGKCCR